MTARVIAEERDQYAEYVGEVAVRLSWGSGLSDWLGAQSTLGREDLVELMLRKGIEDRDKVHKACRWPEVPEGQNVCCPHLVTCLQNVARDALRKETRSRLKKKADKGSAIPVDPAAFSGTLSETDFAGIHHQLMGAYERLAGEAESIAAAAALVERAFAALTADQFDAAVTFGVEGLKGDGAAQRLGISARTARDRWMKARQRVLAALASPEAD